MMLFASCKLPLSHLRTVFPTKLPLFFNWKSFPDLRTPPDAVAAAPVSVLTELIVISLTPEFTLVEILVAPEASSLKSPNASASEFAAI